jgi:hypothetical protein
MRLLARTNTTAKPPKLPAGFNKLYDYWLAPTQQQGHQNLLQDLTNVINQTSLVPTLRTYSDRVGLRQNSINWVSTPNDQRRSKL